MAKSFMLAGLIAATALCLSVSLTSAAGDDYLYVRGHVYCDPCRVEFQTKISTPIPDTTVKLTCRSRENDTVSYETTAKTNSNGDYTLPADGDHEDDICEVTLVETASKDCNTQFSTADGARVLLTKNVGVVAPVRFANALGYKTEGADQRCAQTLQDMGFPPLEADELLSDIRLNV